MSLSNLISFILALTLGSEAFSLWCHVDVGQSGVSLESAQVATHMDSGGTSTVLHWPGSIAFLEDAFEQLGNKRLASPMFYVLPTADRTSLRSLTVAHGSTSPISSDGWYAGIKGNQIFVSQTKAYEPISLPKFPGETPRVARLYRSRSGVHLVAACDRAVYRIPVEGSGRSWTKLSQGSFPKGFRPDFLKSTSVGKIVLADERGSLLFLDTKGELSESKLGVNWLRDIAVVESKGVLRMHVIAGDHSLWQCSEREACVKTPTSLPKGVFPVSIAGTSVRLGGKISDTWSGGYLSRERQQDQEYSYDRFLILGSDGRLYSPWSLGHSQDSLLGRTTVLGHATSNQTNRNSLALATANFLLTQGVPETPAGIALYLRKLDALPFSTARKNALINSHFGRLKNKRVLDVDPSILEVFSLSPLEGLLFFDFLTGTERVALIKGELTAFHRGPMEEKLQILQQRVDKVLLLLASEEFTTTHSLLSVFAEKEGRLSEESHFFKEFAQWLREHPEWSHKNLLNALIEWMRAKNPFWEW